MAFRHLEDLRGKHRGKEVWVLGRGPSLDDYPLDFFDDKISIAVSLAYLAFPDSTYYTGFHAEPAKWVEKNWPDKFNRYILGCLWGSSYGDNQPRSKYEGSGKVPIYAKVRFSRGKGIGSFKTFVEPLIAKKSCEIVDGATSLHVGIQVAIVLGAKKITLAGCELKSGKGYIHAKRTWFNAAYEKARFKKFAWRARSRIFPNSRKGLRWLVRICKPYGIEIVRYYYGKGYEQIEIS